MKNHWNRRKFKQPTVVHPLLTNLPKQSDDSVIQALLVRVRQGEIEACRKMIEEHMLLAKLKIQDFLVSYRHLKKETDELVSIALLACVDAVNRVKNGAMKDHDNITGYIRVAIWRDLGEWVNGYLSASKHQSLSNVRDTFDIVTTGWETKYDETANNGNNCLAIFESESSLEITDTLESLNLVGDEWYIIESRLVGDTYEEIAEHLQISEFSVRFILSDIQRHFFEKYGD